MKRKARRQPAGHPLRSAAFTPLHRGKSKVASPRSQALERRRLKRRERRAPLRNGDMMDPKVLMDYDRWVAKHFDQLVRKHAGKFIAVYRNKLVAVGDSYKEVSAAADKQGMEEPPLTMQVPGLEDIEAIL